MHPGLRPSFSSCSSQVFVPSQVSLDTSSSPLQNLGFVIWRWGWFYPWFCVFFNTPIEWLLISVSKHGTHFKDLGASMVIWRIKRREVVKWWPVGTLWKPPNVTKYCSIPKFYYELVIIISSTRNWSTPTLFYQPSLLDHLFDKFHCVLRRISAISLYRILNHALHGCWHLIGWTCSAPGLDFRASYEERKKFSPWYVHPGPCSTN